MYKTRALINLTALKHNIGIARQLAGDHALMSVVKADAYGHGIRALLPTLTAHSDALAVARLSEAVVIREAGYQGRLLLLCGVVDRAELQLVFQYHLDLAVHDTEQLSLLQQHCHQNASRHTKANTLTLWPKLDSGMHRLGIPPEHFATACRQLRELPCCGELIAMTHFVCADEPDNPRTTEQVACFNQCVSDGLVDNCSMANSAALLGWPATRTGWVRPGLMLYGVSPVNTATTPSLALQPVMQLQAQVLACRHIEAGDTVGYNDTWCATRHSRIAYVGMGYADGYPVVWHSPPFVVFNGTQLPVIGRVSMDTIAIDCTDCLTSPQTGDWVELWGNHLPVNTVAQWAGTIPYELLTGVSSRVQRVYQ